ncbi:hypothetical protein FKM82_029461 [Ascaphus truei]
MQSIAQPLRTAGCTIVDICMQSSVHVIAEQDASACSAATKGVNTVTVNRMRYPTATGLQSVLPVTRATKPSPVNQPAHI